MDGRYCVRENTENCTQACTVTDSTAITKANIAKFENCTKIYGNILFNKKGLGTEDELGWPLKFQDFEFAIEFQPSSTEFNQV